MSNVVWAVANHHVARQRVVSCRLQIYSGTYLNHNGRVRSFIIFKQSHTSNKETPDRFRHHWGSSVMRIRQAGNRKTYLAVKLLKKLIESELFVK